MDSYLKGCLAGMFGIALSHPIDTLKTAKQSGVKITYNLMNLYKGIFPPLVGVGLEKALVFGTYQYLRKQNVNVPISGAISGFVATFVVTPYERLKILKQTSQHIKKIDLSQLYKGFSATFTREVPGFAIYFSTYEYLKKRNIDNNTSKLSPLLSFLFGGISGSMAWLFIYPQDRIKTIIQSTNDNKKISVIIKNTFKNGGIKSFYSGFSYAISRAVLLHAGTFMMFELLDF